MKIGVLDSNGRFGNPFFHDSIIHKVGDKWKGQEYKEDLAGFTHAEYVCSFIIKENPKAEIFLVPIINKNYKCSVQDMIDGIELLIKENVDIINMSIGDEYKYHKELDAICQRAAEHGIVLVSAYSNRNTGITYPAMFSYVIGVKCINIKNPYQVYTYDQTQNNITFSSSYFSLYHLGIAKFFQGNSFACAIITGFLSNYKKNYKRQLLKFIDSAFNKYYPYELLKQKRCYFLTNRMDDLLEKKFILEVTNTILCEPFREGVKRFIKREKNIDQCQVMFIDHNNYGELCSYKSVIKKYAEKNLDKEMVLRYPLFSLQERLIFEIETKGILNQFCI